MTSNAISRLHRLLPALLLAAVGMLTCGPSGLAQTRDYRLVHRGNQHFKAQRYDRAAASYLNALRRNPSNSRALFNLADTYLTRGNNHAADSLFARVVQLERSANVRAMAWHNRGYIAQSLALNNPEQRQQLLRQAIEHYKQALRLNPRDNDTRYNLALCQKQLKDSHNQQKPQPKQQPKPQQQPKGGQQNKQQQQPQPQPRDNDRQQTEQYINLARQAERRALERLKNQQPRQKSLEKNW